MDFFYSEPHDAEARRCRLMADDLTEGPARALLLRMATLYDSMALVATKRELLADTDDSMRREAQKGCGAWR